MRRRIRATGTHLHRVVPVGAAAFTVLLSFAAVVHADASKLAPEVGYNYAQTETPRIAAMGGALRAFSNSTEALFVNPANMAVSRVYHLGAFAQIWPEANRQSYGAAIVDSIVSASRLSGGVSAIWTRQDPDGVDRTDFDIRFALAYPFSDHVFVGATGHYLSLHQSGFPSRQYNLHPSEAAGGLSGKPIVENLTFDGGLTVKPIDELAFSVVGYDLTNPGNGFLPLMLGGGAAYGTTDFTVEADVLGDFTTYKNNSARAMFGAEYLAGDHFPLRAGYRYDSGALSHTATFGVGYLDSSYTFDIALERTVSGPSATAVIIGFKYHVESGGIAPPDTD
jgi:hypothetical protein